MLLVVDLQKSYDYAGSVMYSLEEIPKMLNIQEKIYNLRGIIAFSGLDRSQLRNPTGHYMAYCFRSNGIWECYDDTKNKIKICGYRHKVNIELLLYTQ